LPFLTPLRCFSFKPPQQAKGRNPSHGGVLRRSFAALRAVWTRFDRAPRKRVELAKGEGLSIQRISLRLVVGVIAEARQKVSGGEAKSLSWRGSARGDVPFFTSRALLAS
jgi:hypothetical protein